MEGTIQDCYISVSKRFSAERNERGRLSRWDGQWSAAETVLSLRNFLLSQFVVVHTILFPSLQSVYCHHSLSLGPEVKAIKRKV